MQVDMPNPVPLLIVIVLALCAIVGSKRKLQTALTILGSMVLGMAIGIGIGLALDDSGAAGSAAGILVLIMGGGAAIKETIAPRKAKTSAS